MRRKLATKGVRQERAVKDSQVERDSECECISGDVEHSSVCIASSKLSQYTTRISKYSTWSESYERRYLQSSETTYVFPNEGAWLGWIELSVLPVNQDEKTLEVR